MSGIPALDVVIGLVFIYLLYSLLASIIQEMIATNLGFRAKILQKAIIRMLEHENGTPRFWSRLNSWKSLVFFPSLKDKPFAQLFYQNTLIKYLGEDKWHSKPSYMGAPNFSRIILEILKGETKPGEDIRRKIEEILYPDPNVPDTHPTKLLFGKNLDNPTLKHLRSLWSEAQADVEKFKLLLENWFNETMERTTGWYKRYTQVVLFMIGMGIAVAFNVDSIQIIKKLSKDPELRRQVVQYAGDYLKNNPDLEKKIQEQQARIDAALAKKDSATLAKENAKADSIANVIMERNRYLTKTADSLIKNDIKQVNDILGLGWNSCEKKKCGCCWPTPVGGWSGSLIVGWILTALALSLGAPFWFDLLNKLMKMRASVDKGDSTGASSKSNTPGTLQRKG